MPPREYVLEAGKPERGQPSLPASVVRFTQALAPLTFVDSKDASARAEHWRCSNSTMY